MWRHAACDILEHPSWRVSGHRNHLKESILSHEKMISHIDVRAEMACRRLHVPKDCAIVPLVQCFGSQVRSRPVPKRASGKPLPSQLVSAAASARFLLGPNRGGASALATNLQNPGASIGGMASALNFTSGSIPTCYDTRTELDRHSERYALCAQRYNIAPT